MANIVIYFPYTQRCQVTYFPVNHPPTALSDIINTLAELTREALYLHAVINS
jgi:hypothetical protein